MRYVRDISQYERAYNLIIYTKQLFDKYSTLGKIYFIQAALNNIRHMIGIHHYDLYLQFIKRENGYFNY